MCALNSNVHITAVVVSHQCRQMSPSNGIHIGWDDFHDIAYSLANLRFTGIQTE